MSNLYDYLQSSVRWYRRWGTAPVRPWILAADAFRSGDYSQAAQFYKDGLGRFQSHPAAQPARFDYAYCLYREGKLAEAISEVRKLTNFGSRVKEAYLLEAKLALIVGDCSSAMEVMDRAIENFEEDLQVLSCFVHTSLYAKFGIERLTDVVTKLYSMQGELSVNDMRKVHADTALAHYEIRCGDLRKGERILARVLATGSAPYEAVLIRGERLLEQGRVMPSRIQLTRAMIAAPRDPRPVLMIARSYLKSSSEFNPTWACLLAQRACRLANWQNADGVRVLVRAYAAADRDHHAELYAGYAESLEGGTFERPGQFQLGQKVSNS